LPNASFILHIFLNTLSIGNKTDSVLEEARSGGFKFIQKTIYV